MKSIMKKIVSTSDVITAVILVFIIALIIIKIPAHIMDSLLVIVTSLSLMVFIISIFLRKPLDFAILPTVILLITLVRSALNISLLRTILLDGHRGSAGVGYIIDISGKMIVGSNLVAGFIIFFIITVVNFLFISDIIERIAQIGARVTIDYHPGRDMSIDADLNTGLIDPKRAKSRRWQIEREADFYGSMDGTGKFIKAEAVLLVIITLTGITGGTLIGTLRYGMTAAEAINLYTSLSVGNAFILAFSAFLMSIATGVVAGRVASDYNTSFYNANIIKHVSGNPETLLVFGTVMFIVYELMAVKIIHFPAFPFLFLAITSKILWWILRKYHKEIENTIEEAEEKKEVKKEESSVCRAFTEMLTVEMGRKLLPFIDPNNGAILLDSVTSMRRFILMETGMIVPDIRFRDNLSIPSETYVIKIKGEEVARGEVLIDKFLSIGQEKSLSLLEGIRVKEPVYNMSSVWISSEDRVCASSLGCLVIDPVKVITSHLTDVIKKHASSLFSRNSVELLLDDFRKSYPVVLKELYPCVFTLNEIEKVLRNLLNEHVSIKDLVTIFETMGDYAHITKNPDTLTMYVRQALCRQICRQYADSEGKIKVLTVEPDMEKMIEESIINTESPSFLNIDVEIGMNFISCINGEFKKLRESGIQAVILTSPMARTYVRRMIEKASPDMIVLSYNEIAPGVEPVALGMIEALDRVEY